MSKHLEYLRRSLGGETVRSFADGVGVAVATTADELVTARAAALGSGGRLERFALRDLSGVRILPNPHASMFEAQFAGGRMARLMYHREAGRDIERLAESLQEILGNDVAVPGGKQVAVGPVPAPEVVAPLPAADEGGDDDARTARKNRILLAMVLIPLVLLYVYSAFSR